MSKAKQKGTAAESAVIRYLNDNGFPTAERRALSGINDKGDVTGIPGLVIEIKAGARLEIPAWLRETAIETANAKADNGVLVIKPKGKGEKSVGEWWAVMPLAQMVELLREVGYGDPR